jgi:hypothetical protein
MFNRMSINNNNNKREKNEYKVWFKKKGKDEFDKERSFFL